MEILKETNFDLDITPLFSQEQIRDKYYEDQEKLNNSWDKYENDLSLDKDDLEFLYEINDKILSVKGRDTRIEQMLEGRDIKSDLSYITGLDPEEISISKEEVFLEDKKFHYGNLNFRDVEYAPLGMVFPEIVVGNINLANLKNTNGVVGPKSMHGDWYLNSVNYLDKGFLPEKMKGALGLHSLITLDEFSLPEIYTGPVFLGVEYIDGYKFKEDKLAGFMEFPKLKKAKNFTPPRILTGGFYMSKLVEAENVMTPDSVGSVIDFKSLKKMKGIVISNILECQILCKSISSSEKSSLSKKYPNIVFL